MAVENTEAFRRLVEVFMAEANLHGWPASDRAATVILSRRVEQGAALLRVKPATVLGTYLGEDQVRDMVRDLIPLVVADGGTGRDDEPDVLVSRDLAGRLVADLGQAGRFAASHRDHLPEAGLHNVVADECVILGAAISESLVIGWQYLGTGSGSPGGPCTSLQTESPQDGAWHLPRRVRTHWRS